MKLLMELTNPWKNAKRWRNNIQVKPYNARSHEAWRFFFYRFVKQPKITLTLDKCRFDVDDFEAIV